MTITNFSFPVSTFVRGLDSDLLDLAATAALNVSAGEHATALVLATHLATLAVSKTEGRRAAPENLQRSLGHVHGVCGAVDGRTEVRDAC